MTNVWIELNRRGNHSSTYLDKWWVNLYPKNDGLIKKPAELDNYIESPPDSADEKIRDRIQGSLIGMTLGDALGAHVEFRPHGYLLENPVQTLNGGGTWGLVKGQVSLSSQTGFGKVSRWDSSECR